MKRKGVCVVLEDKTDCCEKKSKAASPELALHSTLLKRQNQHIKEYEEIFCEHHHCECIIEAQRKGIVSRHILRIKDILDISKTYHPNSLNFLKDSHHGKKFISSLKSYIKDICDTSFLNFNSNLFCVHILKDNTLFLIDIQKTFIEVYPVVRSDKIINNKIPILKKITFTGKHSQTTTCPLMTEEEQVKRAISLD